MIQQNINQLLTTAAAAFRLSPEYDKRVEASELLGKAKAAISGLEATRTGLKERGKKLTETELSDIESRTAELNKNVYSAKIRAKEGDPLAKYLKKGVSQLPSQSEHTGILKDIEKSVAKKREKTWQEKASAKLNTKKNVNAFRDSILLGADERPLQVKEK